MTNEELVSRIQAGQGDRRELMQQLYDQNSGAIWATVRRYQGRAGMDAEDVMQSAYLGLDQAVRKYDPDRGAKFTTCLQYWLMAIVGRADDDIPAYLRQQLAAYDREVTSYRQQCGCDPPEAYLRGVLHVSQRDLEQLRIIKHRYDSISLSTPIGDDNDSELIDVLPEPGNVVDDLIDRLDDERAARILWDAVAALDDQQSDAIRARYQGDGQTLQQVADKMQLTKDQARRCLEKGFRKLRRNKAVRKIASDRFRSRELYGGSLSRFRNVGASILEEYVMRHVDKEVKPRQTPETQSDEEENYVI